MISNRYNPKMALIDIGIDIYFEIYISCPGHSVARFSKVTLNIFLKFGVFLRKSLKWNVYSKK